ncbi:MAG: hypothetical protein HDR00_02535 [Lachnospiraceae bacterium]|nr:hypothetical protein [Lachnospiraceae bacterium]
MISLQDYLKKQLPLFRHITDCAGILLEKNAMNHAPTPEEMKRMEEGAEEIRKNLEQMEKDAKEQVRLYGEKMENADACNRQLMDQISSNYAQFDRLKEQQTAEEIELAKISREEEKEMADLERKKKELEDYKRQQEEARQKREKKRKDATKWCWVPGYNIYLACDYAAEISKGNIETLEHQCNDCKKAIEQFRQKIEERKNSIVKTTQRRNELSAQCDELTRKSSEYQRMIAEHKEQLVYWEDLRMKVESLRNRLETGAASPDDLMELMDTMEMFGKGL